MVYFWGGMGGLVWSFAFDGMTKSLGVAWTFKITAIVVFLTLFPASMFLKERVKRTAPFVDWLALASNSESYIIY
jgi:hypothetical protein